MNKRRALIGLAILLVAFVLWKLFDLEIPFSNKNESNNDAVADTVNVINPILIKRNESAFVKAKYTGQNRLYPIKSGVVIEVNPKPSKTFFEGESILKVYIKASDSALYTIEEIKSPCNCTILNTFEIGKPLNNPAFLEIKDENSLYQIAVRKELFEQHKSSLATLKGVIAPEMSVFKEFLLKDHYLSGPNVILSYSPKEQIDFMENEVWLKANSDQGLDYKIKTSALLSSSDGNEILKVVNNQVERIEVYVWKKESDLSFIIGDISSTDLIVQNPTDSLLNGSSVFPIKVK